MSLTLVIGNKNYSSWSLRAWLQLRLSGIEFAEVRLPMFSEQWYEEIGRYSPSRRVPVLHDGDLVVWDTMAIFEHVLETRDGALGWPAERSARAHARSVAAEMHAGFLAVRAELPQNIRARRPLDPSRLSPDARTQIERIGEIWSGCLSEYGGPWLFGELSLADVVYAPVALRFVTYAIDPGPAARDFMAVVQALPEVARWARESAAEEEAIAAVDDLVPESEGPIGPG